MQMMDTGHSMQQNQQQQAYHHGHGGSIQRSSGARGYEVPLSTLNAGQSLSTLKECSSSFYNQNKEDSYRIKLTAMKFNLHDQVR